MNQVLKGITISILFHIGLFLFFGLAQYSENKKLILTEIMVVEQLIPIPEKMKIPNISSPNHTLKSFVKPAPIFKLKKRIPPLKQELIITSKNLPNKIKNTDLITNTPSPILINKKYNRNITRKAPTIKIQNKRTSLEQMPTIKLPTHKKETKQITLSNSFGKSFVISGGVKDRTILFQQLPKYPRWLEERGIEGNVSIKFVVLPDGSIKNNVYVEKSSGYSDLDDLGIKAIRTFRFVAINKQEEQGGIIVFYFKLNRK